MPAVNPAFELVVKQDRIANSKHRAAALFRMVVTKLDNRSKHGVIANALQISDEHANGKSTDCFNSVASNSSSSSP
jgi:hypothetical protein